MKAIIVYNRYYNFLEEKVYIGGVETYINNLIEVLKEYVSDIIIIQFSDTRQEKRLDDKTLVVGIHENKVKRLIEKANKYQESDRDLFIFASSALICKTKFNNVIAIQHGIYWDMDYIHGIKKIPEFLSICIRCLESLREIHRQKFCNLMVCVDYNYINWYRTQSIKRLLNYKVIPNFVKKSNRTINIKNGKDKISIVYARRFEVTRGVDLLINTLPEILERYDNVELTIAGIGSMESAIRNVFKKFKQVKITNYASEDGVKFHEEFDIAIVPSNGSEGTSLSLLEAMAAGCAVIATDVGGMTNILLNGYNGIIIKPNKIELKSSLEKLICNSQLRCNLRINAQYTVNEAFSYQTWEQKWKEVIEQSLM